MANEKILGIDLGTTFSCMSIMEAGKPIVIPNVKEHEQLRPSSHLPKTGSDWSGALQNVRLLQIPSEPFSLSSVRWVHRRK